MMVAVFFMFGDNDESAQDGEDAESESPSIARVPLGRAVGLAMLVVPGSFAGAPDIQEAKDTMRLRPVFMLDHQEPTIVKNLIGLAPKAK
jgi:hypothetical protein